MSFATEFCLASPSSMTMVIERDIDCTDKLLSAMTRLRIIIDAMSLQVRLGAGDEEVASQMKHIQSLGVETRAIA